MSSSMAIKQAKVKKCDIAERIAMDNAYSITRYWDYDSKKNERERHEKLRLFIAMTI